MQTSYSNSHAVAREGMVADNGYRDTISKAAEVATPAGRVVVRGSAGNQCKLPVTGTDVTTNDALGISQYLSAKEPETSAAEYAVADMVSVVKKGRVWVSAEDAVTAGDAVYVRHTAGEGEELGRMRSDTDSGDASVLPGASWETTTSGSNKLALVELNLPF